MELVKYSLCGLDLMMVDVSGILYCSTPQLERVFGVDKATLTRFVSQYPQDFSNARCGSLTSSNDQRKEFLEALELSRLRKDTRLWSEDDVIGITWLLRSDVARTCRTEFKEIIKKHSSKAYVPRDLYNQMVDSHQGLREQMSFLNGIISDMSDRLSNLEGNNTKIAKHAKRTLHLCK